MADQTNELPPLSMSQFATEADYWKAMHEARENEAHELSEEIIRLRRAALASRQAPEPGNASAWWALVMGAAASIEDAANCLRDPDAKKQADGAAKHYREAAQKLYVAPPSSPSTGEAKTRRQELLSGKWDWSEVARKPGASPSADARALLEQARPYVEDASTRYYDGTIGHHRRAAGKSLLAAIDAYLSTPASAAPASINSARHVVDAQAEDEALWCDARTPMEAMLQQALRRLHAAVESESAVGAAPKFTTGYLQLDEPSAAPAAPFAKGSWQHAVDDQLVGFGRTSQEFASPHDAVKWLLQQTTEATPAAPKPLTEWRMREVVFAVLRKWKDDRAWDRYTRETGPYDVSVLRAEVVEIIRAIEAAHGIGSAAPDTKVESQHG